MVIGIGGSYLGARAVIELPELPNYNLKQKDTPDIYFAGNGLSTDALLRGAGAGRRTGISPSTSSPSPAPPPSPPWPSASSRELLEKKYGKEGGRGSASTPPPTRHRGAAQGPGGRRGLRELRGARRRRRTLQRPHRRRPAAHRRGGHRHRRPDGAARRGDGALLDLRDSGQPRVAVRRRAPRALRRGQEHRAAGLLRAVLPLHGASGGSSSTARARARTARASSPPASSSPPTCTPWVSTSRRAARRCWRPSCALTRAARSVIVPV